MSVSILLNFTSKIPFEETDPLMSLVNAKEPLLFYDRLTVEKFPTDDKQKQLAYAEGKISSLRNLLEARTFSMTDRGGEIRLIIVLDLSGGLFQEDGMLVFPAQKARRIREMIRKTFGKDNPLLRRMEYAFIFVHSDTDNEQLTRLYLTTAYDGTGGQHFTVDGKTLNVLREEALDKMESPDEDDPIDHSIDFFQEHFTEVRNKILLWLEKTSLVDAFNQKVDNFLKLVKTVKDFHSFDFDETLKSFVRELIGVSADEFCGDCVFFILKVEEGARTISLKDDTFVKALVQLICTISTTDYNQRFKSPGSYRTRARLFVLEDTYDGYINGDAMAELSHYAKACLPKLNDSKWTEDMEVTYNVYTPNASEPQEVDTHRELNDKYAQIRKEQKEEFDRIRRIPFFFGKRTDDWSWFNDVMGKITAIYDFEMENGRPLYDPPKRITNKQMTAHPETTSYRGLLDAKEKLEAKMVKIEPTENLKAYMMGRQELTDKLADSITRLQPELKKLGFFRCLFCIGLYSLLGFTLCYAFHFFWFDNADPYYLIAIAAGAAGLLFVLSSVIGQACVKKKIRAVYMEIDYIYNKLQENLANFLKKINDRIKKQNEADVRRRNLDELEEKLNEFETHKTRIELWKKYFTSIITKIDTTLTALEVNPDNFINNANLNFDGNTFNLDDFPTMPNIIRSRFNNMGINFSTSQITINTGTCFARRLNFTEHTFLDRN